MKSFQITVLNWAIILSIISPIIMIIGLFGTAAVYKDRIDFLNQIISPKFLVEYGRLRERVRNLENRIKLYDEQLNERAFDSPYKTVAPRSN